MFQNSFWNKQRQQEAFAFFICQPAFCHSCLLHFLMFISGPYIDVVDHLSPATHPKVPASRVTREALLSAALVSRQFVEMTRIRIEGLLAAFPKLVGAGKQHTYVETENVRYVYQPMEVEPAHPNFLFGSTLLDPDCRPGCPRWTLGVFCTCKAWQLKSISSWTKA